jgi:hypothetical protein
MATFTGAARERSPDRLDSLVWSCDRLLRQNFGATVPAKFARYLPDPEVKDLPDIGELTREDPQVPGAVRRLASTHGIKAGEWGLEDFEPRNPDEVPQESPNIHRWH